MDNHESELARRPDILEETSVINVGLEVFFESLKDQEIEVIHVKWSPPGGGDEESIRLLDELL